MDEQKGLTGSELYSGVQGAIAYDAVGGALKKGTSIATKRAVGATLGAALAGPGEVLADIILPNEVNNGEDQIMKTINSKATNSMLGDTKKLIEGQEIPPELQKKMDSYIASLMHVIHNPKTADGILEMLGAAPPAESIPHTALYVNDAVEKVFGKKNAQVEDSVKIAGAMYLVSDLSELGNAANVWKGQKVPEQEVPKILQKTMSQYIHKGIREGSIDPIQLQSDTEPLLNDKQRQVGSTLQQKLGLPGEPTASMGIDAYTKKKTAPLEAENAQLRKMLSDQQKQEQQKNGGM